MFVHPPPYQRSRASYQGRSARARGSGGHRDPGRIKKQKDLVKPPPTGPEGHRTCRLDHGPRDEPRGEIDRCPKPGGTHRCHQDRRGGHARPGPRALPDRPGRRQGQGGLEGQWHPGDDDPRDRRRGDRRGGDGRRLQGQEGGRGRGDLPDRRRHARPPPRRRRTGRRRPARSRERGREVGRHGPPSANVYTVWLSPKTKVCSCCDESGKACEKKECGLDKLEVGDRVEIKFARRDESANNAGANHSEAMQGEARPEPDLRRRRPGDHHPAGDAHGLGLVGREERHVPGSLSPAPRTAGVALGPRPCRSFAMRGDRAARWRLA